MKLITIKKLSYSVKNKKKVISILSNVNLEIYKSSCISIFGKNGSGKTTLMEVIFGIRENYLGKITFDKNFQNEIKGFVLQSNWFVTDVIKDLINFHLKLFNKKKSDLNLILEKLDFLEIHEKKLTSQLSKGQKQKLKLAMMILSNPSFLILDEITTSLDYVTRKNILNYLKKWKSEKNITIFMISHDLMEIAYLADSFYILENKTLSLKNNLPNLYNERIELLEKHANLKIETTKDYEIKKFY